VTRRNDQERERLTRTHERQCRADEKLIDEAYRLGRLPSEQSREQGRQQERSRDNGRERSRGREPPF